MKKTKKNPIKSHKKHALFGLCEAFALLEVVFAVLILGVAFGIVAIFYYPKEQTPLELAQIQQNEGQIIAELESLTNPKSHKIIGTNGEFCEGEMFEVEKSISKFRLFKPQNCEQ